MSFGPQRTLGLGFSLLGVFNFQARGLVGLGLLLVAGVWGVQFCVCCVWGCVWGRTATYPNVMLLNSQIEGMCVDSCLVSGLTFIAGIMELGACTWS